jgi:hypothetical protein
MTVRSNCLLGDWHDVESSFTSNPQAIARYSSYAVGSCVRLRDAAHSAHAAICNSGITQLTSLIAAAMSKYHCSEYGFADDVKGCSRPQ